MPPRSEELLGRVTVELVLNRAYDLAAPLSRARERRIGVLEGDAQLDTRQ
jgi:hypothetical protein